MKLEFTCIYVRNYSLLIRAKERADFNQDLLAQFEAYANEELNQKSDEIIEYHRSFGLKISNLDSLMVNDWIEYYENDPYVVAHKEHLSNLRDKVFKEQKLNQIDYSADLPEKFTKDMYIAIYKKIWATIRYEIWKESGNIKK